MNAEPDQIVHGERQPNDVDRTHPTSVVLAGFAQITLKTGVNHVTGTSGEAPHQRRAACGRCCRLPSSGAVSCCSVCRRWSGCSLCRERRSRSPIRSPR